MRVIVTRPEREAQRWAQDLRAQGFDAVALPLIQIGPVPDASAMVRAGQQLAQYRAVMFVSSHAVAHFFRSNPALATVFTAKSAIKTRAWATGPGTAKALLQAGVAAERLDAPALDAGQFDSEALWRVVAAQVQAGERVLIVRGAAASDEAPVQSQGTGRDWLASQIASLGAQVEFVVAYQRCAPAWQAAQRALAQRAASDGSVWLFSSSEAVSHLALALPAQDWARARAVATHPRIASAARKLGFGVVCEARATLFDVVAACESVPETKIT